MIKFFSGKGGVGKSSIIAALAMADARSGVKKRPLIVELAHRATFSDLFGVALGATPTEVSPGVHALRVDTDEGAADFVGRRTGSRRLAKVPVLSRLLQAAPAVNEVLTLERITLLEAEKKWDPIYVDLDATGHALMFFSLPDVFAGLARSGPLRSLLDGFESMVVDEARSELFVVTLPRPLPVQETFHFVEKLRAVAAPRLAGLYLNRMPRALDLDEGELEKLETTMPLEVALARRNLATHAQAEAAAERLTHLALDIVRLEEHDATSALALAKHLSSALEGAQP